MAGAHNRLAASLRRLSEVEKRAALKLACHTVRNRFQDGGLTAHPVDHRSCRSLGLFGYP